MVSLRFTSPIHASTTACLRAGISPFFQGPTSEAMDFERCRLEPGIRAWVVRLGIALTAGFPRETSGGRGRAYPKHQLHPYSHLSGEPDFRWNKCNSLLDGDRRWTSLYVNRHAG